MGTKTLSGHYEAAYDLASQRPEQTDEEETLLFASLAPSDRRLRILDMGCAEGRLVALLARAGHEVTAADISSRQLEKVSRLAANESLKIRTVKCNVEEDISTFGGETFDLVYFLDIVEHLKNSVAGLENLRRLLTPEGTAIIHTPNVCTPTRFARYLVMGNRKEDYFAPGKVTDLHFQTYDYLTLEKTLNFIGLRVSRVIPTRVSLPRLSRKRALFPLYRWAARVTPLLGDTLLLECRRSEPLDLDRVVQSWTGPQLSCHAKP